MSTMMWWMCGCMRLFFSSSVDQVHCQRGSRWTIKWTDEWRVTTHTHHTHTHTQRHTLVITSYVREQRETAESDWVSRTSSSPPLPSVCPSHCGLHLTVKSPTQHNNTQADGETEREITSEVWQRLDVEQHTGRETPGNTAERERERGESVCVRRGGDVM